MKRFLINFGIASLTLLIICGVSYWSWKVGRDETYKETTTIQAQKDTQRNSSENDLIAISDDYKKMSDLCEQKYQNGISGNFTSALETKGQMSELQNQIDKIIAKYYSGQNNHTQ